MLPNVEGAKLVEPGGLFYNDCRNLTLPRPAFIVAEPEPEQAISTRKLLLETFKFNVITAHSERETVDLLHLFPNINALILHCGIEDFDTENVIRVVKTIVPGLPIIALTPTVREFAWADHVVHSHDPQELLQLVHQLFGDPRKHPASADS
jgi:hypothetical protein